MNDSAKPPGISQFYKIVLLGDSGVGKTAIVQRLTDNKFAETTSTIGVQYQPYICPLQPPRAKSASKAKKYSLTEEEEDDEEEDSDQDDSYSDDTVEKVQLQIWDTAGQERYRSISKAYFRNAVGAVVVFDITRVSSFDNVGMWLDDLRQMCNQNAFILLVGNKADCEEEREVGTQEANEYAKRQRIEYVECSALSGKNVAETFHRLAFMISERIKKGELPLAGKPKSSQQQQQQQQQQQKQQKQQQKAEAEGCCLLF